MRPLTLPSTFIPRPEFVRRLSHSMVRFSAAFDDRFMFVVDVGYRQRIRL